VIEHLVLASADDARRCQDIATAALEVEVLTDETSARLRSAGEIDVEAAAAGADESTSAIEQRSPLQLVECRPAITIWLDVNVEDIGPRRPGRDRGIAFRYGAPPGADALLVRGRILEPVRRIRFFAVRLARVDRPSGASVGKRRTQLLVRAHAAPPPLIS
jgi:hypothetical protein